MRMDMDFLEIDSHASIGSGMQCRIWTHMILFSILAKLDMTGRMGILCNILVPCDMHILNLHGCCFYTFE